MERISFCAAVLIFISILLGGCKARKTTFVTIGTGGVTGIYYPTGGAISSMVNKKFDEYKIKATVESTSGSVFNINAVLNRGLEFGVVQSDRQYQAYNGLAEWSEFGKQTDLRAVFSVHPESITLIASEKSGIQFDPVIFSEIINRCAGSVRLERKILVEYVHKEGVCLFEVMSNQRI